MTNERENFRDELAQLAPRLARLPKHNGLSAPAGYFDDLAEQVLAREAAAPKPIFRRRSQTILAIAASFSLLSAAVWWLFTDPTPQSQITITTDWSAVPVETMEAYVLANLDEFDWPLLLESLPAAQQLEFPAFVDSGHTIPVEDLERYLEEEHDDDFFLSPELNDSSFF